MEHRLAALFLLIALPYLAYAHCPSAQYCVAVDTRADVLPDDWSDQMDYISAIITAIHDMDTSSQFAVVHHATETIATTSPFNHPFSAWTNLAALTSKLTAAATAGRPGVNSVFDIANAIFKCDFSAKEKQVLAVIQIRDISSFSDTNLAQAFVETKRTGPVQAFINNGGNIATFGHLRTIPPIIDALKEFSSPPFLHFEFPTEEDILAFLDFGLETFCDALIDEEPLCEGGCPSASVCYAIDESGTSRPRDLTTIYNMITSISSLFKAYAPESAFSAVGFSDNAHVVSDLTSSLETLSLRLAANTQDGGLTASGSGLQACVDVLDIMPDNKVIVLFTDGDDNRSPRGVSVDNAIKESGHRILTVGIGRKVNEAALKNIASGDSTVNRDLYQSVEGYSQLALAVGSIANDLCKASANWSPTPLPSRCEKVICAQCDARMYCYVNSRHPGRNQEICGIVKSANYFCQGSNTKTDCNQICKYKKAEVDVLCNDGGIPFPTYSDTAVCPNSATPNNFATYNVCRDFGAASNVVPDNAKCTSGGICSADRKRCWPENI